MRGWGLGWPGPVEKSEALGLSWPVEVKGWGLVWPGPANRSEGLGQAQAQGLGRPGPA